MQQRSLNCYNWDAVETGHRDTEGVMLMLTAISVRAIDRMSSSNDQATADVQYAIGHQGEQGVR
jgi:hypothetical protein